MLKCLEFINNLRCAIQIDKFKWTSFHRWKSKTEHSTNISLGWRVDVVRKLLLFSLFIKPTNTFCYLLYTSNHPEFIFKNIPKSLFIRLRRICSLSIDYFFYSRELIDNLISRGYNSTFLKKICKTIGNINREALIDYKVKNKEKNFNSLLFFKSFFDFNFLNLDIAFHTSFLKLKLLYPFLNNYKMNVINCLQFNIASLIVHDFKLIKSTSYKTKSCKNCSICEYIDNSSFLKVNNFVIPIQSFSNCFSKNLVYIIICKRCNLFYIGQTKRCFNTRMKEHLNNIKNFIPFCNLMNSAVAIHFNLKGHDYKNDFSCLVFKKDLESNETRLDIELQLIHLVKNLNKKIINIHIPYLFKNKAKLFSII